MLSIQAGDYFCLQFEISGGVRQSIVEISSQSIYEICILTNLQWHYTCLHLLPQNKHPNNYKETDFLTYTHE